MESPLCSVIVVNYNGKKYLDACLSAFEELRYPADRVEILLVDNGSDDGSELEAQARHPRVRLLRNPVNNFAAALNLGVAQARGDYIAFANNDVFPEPSWLAELVKVLERESRAGCAGGKIVFENGRINSVGHRALPDFYWEDEGYNQEDRGQYDREREVEGLCWAVVLFRRSCLEDVGQIDEDYVLYYEDVDTSRRVRERGWRILYTPRARALHVFHGSSQGSRLAEFYCDRNRLIYVAKYHPEELPAVVEHSRLRLRQEWESLYDALHVVVKKLVESHPPQTLEPILEALCAVLVPIYGALGVDHLLARMQVIFGHRKMSVGFYDHALHLIGGGQKYGCTMAAVLQEKFDVTFIANKHVSREDLQAWYGLPLPRCRLKILPLEFFDRNGAEIDPKMATPEVPNPFVSVGAGSQRFDVFVNVNQLTLVSPLSPFSVFLCHFPDTLRGSYFAVDDYSCLVTNSAYTASWVRSLWGLEPLVLLYPPVDMEAAAAEKENIILSAARFEIGGSKKQHELIRAFEKLRGSEPELLRDWRLVLVGGSVPQNPYLEEVRRLARMSLAPVEVRVNVSLAELQGLYARAKVFWHACGLQETDPHLIEHFGMTTVEAMQNRCVPIVINGGGQREIVEHGSCGYRFDTLEELCHYTREVIAHPDLMATLGEAAYQRGRVFGRQRFEEFVRRFFDALEEDYHTPPRPDPRQILKNQARPSLFYSPLARRFRPRPRAESVGA